MTGTRESQEQQTLAFHYGSDVPNFPEVSGTSFPVLTTVLAGFAVTITVEIALQPNSAGDLPLPVILALGAFLLSTLALLFSTVFAINAQARNYLPFLDLNDVGACLLQVNDINEWLLSVERKWYMYHWAALYTFYSGVALLLAGINLVVWIYVGAILAVLFLAAVVIIFSVTVALAVFVDRTAMRRRMK